MSKSAKIMSTGKSRISSIVLTGFAIFVLFASLMIGLKLKAPIENNRWYINEQKRTADIIDFFQYYQASDLAHSNQSVKVYDPEIQKQWAHNLIAPYKIEKVFYNQQPPSSYTLLWPLSLLKPNIAYVLWCLGQLIFGGFGLYLLSKQGHLDRQGRIILVAGTLASFPSYILIWHGNTTYWLLGLICLAIYFLYHQKDLLSGVALALATFKPQYIFPVITPIFAMKRWKVIFALAITEAILLLSAIPIIGLENVLNYPNIVLHAESSADFIGVNADKIISVRGFFAQFVSTNLSLKLSAIIMFVALVPLFISWKKVSQNLNPDILRWLWAFSICLFVLVSPHSHLFDFLLLSMAAALTLPTVSLFTLKRLKFSEKIWTVLFVIFPPVSWIANYTIGKDYAAILFFFPYVLILFVVSAIRLTEEVKSNGDRIPNQS